MWCKSDRSVRLTGVAVVAVGLAATWFIVCRGPGPMGDDQVEVLVVSKDIPIATLLDESAVRSHIGRAKVRGEQLPADAIRDEQQILGKRVARTLRAGEYLSDRDVGHFFITPIPDVCMYEVRIDPDDPNIDTLRPGDRVDLFVGLRTASEPLLKRLLVLAVNTADRVLAVAIAP